jgi:hypothetical protein
MTPFAVSHCTIFQGYPCLTDLHYARAFFNPYLLREALLPLWCKCQKNTHSPTSYARPLNNFAYFDFVESWRPFFDTPPIDNLNLLPHEWWGLIRTNGCTIAPITHNNLTQVCSMALCKWNWNSFSFVHKCKINSH